MSNKISTLQMRKFRQEALSAHNKLRDDHGVQRLKMDDNLCKEAQKWAEHLVKTESFKHSAAQDYGENLSSSYNSANTEYSGAQVSDYWYSEIEKYDFKSKVFKKGTGHFTQMVWKDCKDFGIGKAITKDGKVIVVGQYKPAGNMLGQFQDNVFPPKRGIKIGGSASAAPAAGGRGRKDSTSSSSSSSDDESKKHVSARVEIIVESAEPAAGGRGWKKSTNGSSSSSDGEGKKHVSTGVETIDVSTAPAASAAGGRGWKNSTSSSSSSSYGESKKSKDKDDSWKLRVSRSEQKEFQKEALKAHNEYRRHHKVAPLEASRELNRKAKRWAKHLAKNNIFEHSTVSDVGENVAMHYSSLTTAYSGKEASDHWYSELGKYNFKAPGFQKGAGHFTQMVWKESKEFGIGKAITKEGKVIIVGQYRPPGNVVDHFDGNVLQRDDGYVPPPPQTGPTRVTRIIKSDGPDTRTISEKELADTVKRTGKLRLEKADTNPKDLKDFRKDLVKAQNDFRKKHQVAKLKESPDLMEKAQKFASYLAENDLFQNSTEDDVGENIAMHYSSASTEFSGQQCADMWYKQVEKYNFKKPEFTKGAGHFTQMVWQDSKEFGAGKAVTREGKVILVGFYKPPGNVMRRFEENVKPPKK